ncbi:MAG: hypothetical protein M5U22_13935 [Thermoleophilia bacterium]|nr:hypothetical protein [Thermoleophilia bacterium]
MVDVLNSLPDDVKDFIEYKEWSIKNPEGIQMFMARKGRVLPTLCINEACLYESIIPTLDELYDSLIAAARTSNQKDILSHALKKAMEEYE